MTAASASGSVGDEAARLLEALQDAARTWQQGDRDAHEHPEDEGVPAACRVCPVCQLIAAFQQVRPETVRHLADAAASLTAALAELVPTKEGSASGGTGQRSQATRDPGRPPRAADDVQHIDITD